jgi:sRNA-binding regulator protein Hfq
VNRKLIRPTLAEVRSKTRETPVTAPAKPIIVQRAVKEPSGAASAAPQPAIQVRKRQPPPAETFAELYYYKKQIDAHTLMVIVLQDGEEVEGTIEWYDRNALKINRHTEPNLLLLKHNIKYMFKAEDRDAKAEAED